MLRLLVLICIAAALAASNRQSLAQDSGVKSTVIAKASGGTQVVMLGAGTPNAEPERSGSAVAIIVNGTPYFVDCGPGVVRRASAAASGGITALDPANIKHLFVTHLHSDHTAGFPDFILTPWVLGRDEPLIVYGPPGIRSMSEHILKAYELDIQVRITGLEHANNKGYKVDAHEIEPGLIYTDDNVKVRAFAVQHGSWKHAFGFRFETADRTIVISGDTVPSANLIENAKGCDVLVHEVYSASAFKERSPEWQLYHTLSHTSSVELARIANEVKPKVLVLYHQLLWGASEKSLVAEIKELYKGKVAFGRDLTVY